jgi:hypothetical protein
MLKGSLILSALFFLPSLALATLGEHSDSVSVDSHALKGARRLTQLSTQQNLFTIHEIAVPGSTVKEYVAADGLVFAVTWRGMSRPDLSVLLGSYFTEYQDAASEQIEGRAVRGPLAVQSSSVVVHHHGHMRDIQGEAYIPDRVPAGVRVEDLK